MKISEMTKALIAVLIAIALSGCSTSNTDETAISNNISAHFSDGSVRSNSTPQLIELGPAQTRFWKRLQTLIANKQRLDSVDQIADVLNVTFVKPSMVDTDNADKFGVRKLVIENGDQIIKDISYSTVKQNIKRKGIGMGFSLGLFCLTSAEVHRVYGWGTIGMANHQLPFSEKLIHKPEERFTGTAGLRFVEVYEKPTSVVFSYANSGCLEHLTIEQLPEQ